VTTTADGAARWFKEHFEDAADEILEFLGGDGISLEGCRVADVGCGDGIIDLGLALKGRPAELVGYDLIDVDSGALLRAARGAGVAGELPPALRFERSEPTAIPAADESFEIVVTWSVFEHVDDPVSLLWEVRRILKPEGYLFLQLWPFYDSEHGGHLWPHYEGPFPHLLRPDEQILREVEGRQATDPRRSAEDEYRSLNKITLDELHRALLANGLIVAKLKLIAQAVHIPRQLTNRSLGDLGIGGVELIATKPL
jgi:SAM-dependent methyltransferase